MQELSEHPTVKSSARAPSNLGLEESPVEDDESAEVSATSTIPTTYSDCEPHGFGSRYGHSPR